MPYRKLCSILLETREDENACQPLTSGHGYFGHDMFAWPDGGPSGRAAAFLRILRLPHRNPAALTATPSVSRLIASLAPGDHFRVREPDNRVANCLGQSCC